jgi:hypothetical protein
MGVTPRVFVAILHGGFAVVKPMAEMLPSPAVDDPSLTELPSRV